MAAQESLARGVAPEENSRLRRLRRELGLGPGAVEMDTELSTSGNVRLCKGGVVAARFRIEQLLGRGNSGRTFLATDLRMNRPVVVKEVMHQDGASLNPGLKEARVAGALSHPNVLTIHDVIDGPDASLIITEYLERGSLTQVLQKEGSLPMSEGVALVEQVLEGLEAVHARGILHRDIKPENILLTADGHPKVADFGIAVTDQTLASLPAVTAAGTPLYMAPEQLRGLPPTAASDLFAVGRLMQSVIRAPRPPTGPDGAYVTGTLEGVPVTGLFHVVPDAGEGACVFDVGLSAPMTRATLKMGRGGRAGASWDGLHDQWATVDLTDNQFPHVDLQLRGFQQFSLCQPAAEALRALATVGAGSNLHVSFTSAAQLNLLLDLTSMPGGTFSYLQNGDGIFVDTPGTVGRLVAGATVSDKFMERDIVSLLVRATQVPSHFEAVTGDGLIKLATAPATASLTSLDFNMLLGGPAADGGRGEPAGEFQPLTIDARDFHSSGTTVVRISDTGGVRFPGSERNKFAYNDNGKLEMGFDLASLAGGTIVITDETIFSAKDWGVGGGAPLRGRVELKPTKDSREPVILSLFVSQMPTTLGLSVDASSVARFFKTSGVVP